MSETRIVLRRCYPFHPTLSYPWYLATVRGIAFPFRHRAIARLSRYFTVIKMCLRHSAEVLGI